MISYTACSAVLLCWLLMFVSCSSLCLPDLSNSQNKNYSWSTPWWVWLVAAVGGVVVIVGFGAVGTHLKKQKEQAEAKRLASEEEQYAAQSIDAENGYPPPTDPAPPAPTALVHPSASTVV